MVEEREEETEERRRRAEKEGRSHFRKGKPLSGGQLQVFTY